jgi:hypothetical protein
VSEGGNATYTITLSRTSSQPVTVNYSMSGTAAKGPDYTLSGVPGHVTIPPGATSGQVTLHANTDQARRETTETAIMTLTSGPGYSLSTSKKATISILNVR